LPKYRHLPEFSHRQWHYCGILAVEDFDGEYDISTLQQKKMFAVRRLSIQFHRPAGSLTVEVRSSTEGCIRSEGYRCASLRMATQVSSGIARKVATT
jgi:hypothetical protein